jgi:hypothetical protein
MTAGARYSLPGINLLRGSAADVVLLAQAAGALTALIGQRVGLVILATALFVSFPLAMLVTWQLLTHPEHEPQPHLEQLDGLASIGISLRQPRDRYVTSSGFWMSTSITTTAHVPIAGFGFILQMARSTE